MSRQNSNTILKSLAKEWLDNIPLAFIGVLLVGFFLRLYSLHETMILNPDGPLYIYQARALYTGKFSAVGNCTLSYLTNYPIFISGAYFILRDWILAAHAVSIFFGTLMLIPLYLLLRCFFARDISTCATLLFAVIPSLVCGSVDVIKDSPYWFFSLFGLYWFTKGIKENRQILFIWSSVAFIMTAWARIEGVLFIAISFISIPLITVDRRLKKTFFFCTPLMVLLALLAAYIAATTHAYIDWSSLHRGQEIIAIFNPDKFFKGYHNIYAALTEQRKAAAGSPLYFFLSEARRFMPVTALAMLVNRFLEAFFYPFAFLAMLGMCGFRKKISDDRVILYFALLISGGGITLYLETLSTWILEYRYMFLIILPMAPFVGWGIKIVLDFMVRTLKLGRQLAVFLLVMLIIGATLPKNLQARGSTETAFREIGTTIAEQNAGEMMINIAASGHHMRLLSFYANVNNQNASCPENMLHSYGNIIGATYSDLIDNVCQANIHYLLWEENNWPKTAFSFLEKKETCRFQEIGQWYNHQTGKMILFKVNCSPTKISSSRR